MGPPSRSASSDLQGIASAEIRAELARQRRSAAWLARELGVSEMWVSARIASGRVSLDLDDIDRIARVLQVEPTELLGSKAAS